MTDGHRPQEPHSANGLDLDQLAHAQLSDWPAVARSWIERGYSSQVLSDFAALSPAEGAVLADLMIDVLRSLGVEVGVDRDIAEHVFTISGFERRCRQAVAQAGSDLQRTWRDVEVGVLASDHWGGPPILVHALVGDYNSRGTEPMTVGMTDEELVETSARQISDTLHEHIGVRWPLCVVHAEIMTPHTPPDADRDASNTTPSWWCPSHRRPVAPIGALTPDLAQPEGLWWAKEAEMPPLRS